MDFNKKETCEGSVPANNLEDFSEDNEGCLHIAVSSGLSTSQQSTNPLRGRTALNHERFDSNLDSAHEPAPRSKCSTVLATAIPRAESTMPTAQNGLAKGNGNAGKDALYLKTSSEQLNRRKSSTETSVFSYSIVPPELVLSDCVSSTQDLSKWQESDRKTLRSALPEIFASCAATSFHLMVGVTFACTSSLMPQLEAPDSDVKTTKTELAWIVSIIFIVIPFTSIFVGFFMEHFGRLNAVKMAAVPSIASCVLIALSTDANMIICGRLLLGIGTALGTNPAVVYVTEITSAEYRGALISSGPTLSSLGMLIGYVMGAFLPWRMVSWINIAFCLVPVIWTMCMFIPESPPWLVSKGRIELARNSLMWLARWEDEGKRDKIVERKLKELMKDREEKLAAARGRPSFMRKFAGLRRPTGYKPMVIMIIMFFFQQYTGVYITTFYIVQYFEAAGSKMNPFHASILVGLTRFVMSLVTVYLLKRFGRRPLCFTSCIGMGTFVAISGYYTHKVMVTGENLMMPVYMILLFIAFSMIGMLSLPWTMAAEVFPTEIRGIAHGIVVASAHTIMFISLQSYYSMAEFFGGHDGLQWFFAGMCVLAFIFIYLFLPETHSKTLIEIETYFENHTIYVRQKPGKSKTKSEPRERKISIKTLAKMEALPENYSEYDTLVKDSQKNFPKIVTTNSHLTGDSDARCDSPKGTGSQELTTAQDKTEN